MVRKLDIQVARRAVVVVFAAALCVLRIFANDGFDDGVDRSDPKFVTASLLVMDPGEELFSCVGHAAIRLECPTFKLDYCFSYESERAVDRLPAFFAGRLKMGMLGIKTEEFLEDYPEKYDFAGKKVTKLGISFSSSKRTIIDVSVGTGGI